MNQRLCLALCVIVFFPTIGRSQPDRYDVGRKLIAFEHAYDQQPDSEFRKRANPFLQRAFRLFMTGRMSEAGRILDEARWSLSPDPIPDYIRWTDALVIRPARRLLDPKTSALSVQVKQLYDPNLETPKQMSVVLTLASDSGLEIASRIDSPLATLPGEFRFQSLKSYLGDAIIRVTIKSEGKVLQSKETVVTLVPNLDNKLNRLQKSADTQPDTGLSTDQLTLKSHVKMLSGFTKGNVGETAYPLLRFLNEAETIASMPAGAKYFDGNRSGQFWLHLATSRAGSVRLLVPESSKLGKPSPLVVAMHGAGGSENLFFDAYGHGEIVRQCTTRGWFLVGTRTEFFATPPVHEIVDELARHYPINKSKVFIVGHSMGAGQAIALARQSPDRWAGVSALGGAARVNVVDALKKVPFFIGCGTEDFAFRGAKSLAKSLIESGVESVEFRDYPDIEHIAIVQVALPDVFKWYDSLIAR